MKNITTRILWSVLLLSSLSLASCKWGKGDAAESSLLKKVPANAAVVMHSVPADKRAQALMQSPLGKAFMEIQKKLIEANAQNPYAAHGLKLANALQRSGITEWNTDSSVSAENVMFTVPAGNLPISTTIIKVKSGINAKTVLSNLEQALKAEQVTVTRSTDGAFETLITDLGSEGNAVAMLAVTYGTNPTVYASDDMLVLAPNVETVKAAFNDRADNIEADPKFQAALKTLKNPEDRYGLVYADAETSINLIKQSVGGAAELVDANNNPATKIKSLISKMSYNESQGATYDVAIALNDADQSLTQKISSNGTLEILSSSPHNSVFFLALDAGLVKPIIEQHMSQLDAQSKAMLESSGILSLSQVLLGLSQSSGASPFPDVFVSAKTNQAPQVVAALKQLATATAQGNGMPNLPWQTKTIGTTTVDSVITPLGVGVFLAALPDSIIATSSEAAMVGLLSGDKSRATVFAPTRPQGTFAGGYLSMPKLFDLFESLKGTLAMFTGGAAPIDTTQYQYLKQIGAGYFVASLEGSVVTIHTAVGK